MFNVPPVFSGPTNQGDGLVHPGQDALAIILEKAVSHR
jgi:hypothetical protein